jgi:hypothetical protein
MNQGDSNGFFMKIVLGAMKMVLGAIFIFNLTSTCWDKRNLLMN